MGIRPRITFENIAPKLDGGYKNIGLIDPVVSNTVYPNLGLEQTPADFSKGDKWIEWSLNLSIADMISEPDLKNYNTLLKNVDTITKGMVIVIKIIRLLSSDLFSINRALKFVIKQIVITLKELVNSFMASGLYYTLIFPSSSANSDGIMVPTWGDFNEFKNVIISSCVDSRDTGSPSQLNVDSSVGGFIIGGMAGSSDPRIIDSICSNARIISQLFNFKIPLPGPPKHLVALEGAYGTDTKKTGIKVTWNKPDHYISNGFLLFRSTNKKGDFPTKDQMGAIIKGTPAAKDPNQVRDFQKIKMYDNKGFNSDKPVYISYTFGQETYTYTDYDIDPKADPNTIYYYKVYTVLSQGIKSYESDPYFFRIDSPLASNEASAKAYSCIPVSEIPKGVLTMDGDFLDVKELFTPGWKTVSVAKFLGTPVESLLKEIENFADKLIGYLSTASDSINDYLTFFANKISDYVALIQTITNIINILMNFRLKGSLLFLNLTAPQKGGIQRFAERISKSTVESKIMGRIPRTQAEIIGDKLKPGLDSATSNDLGQSLAELRGIYYGLVVVYGVGDPSNIGAYAAPYMEEYNDVAKQIEDSQKTIDMLLKILLGKS